MTAKAASPTPAASVDASQEARLGDAAPCVLHRWVFGDIDPATGVNKIKCERCGKPQPAEGVEGNLWTLTAP